MKKFLYFLTDSPTYPNEIIASSASEVKKLLLENLADESQILRIVEVKPKVAPPQQVQAQQNPDIEKAIYADPDEYKNGKDFFNNVLNAATSVSANSEVKKQDEPAQAKEQTPAENNAASAPAPMPVLAPESSSNQIVPKYFEEAGIKFKFENGKLYKKVWTIVNNDERPEFRIINIATNKEITSSKYKIEKLEWTEIT